VTIWRIARFVTYDFGQLLAELQPVEDQFWAIDGVASEIRKLEGLKAELTAQRANRLGGVSRFGDDGGGTRSGGHHRRATLVFDQSDNGQCLPIA
jgi:hypothetical protein